MKIVQISGKKGSGKSETQKLLAAAAFQRFKMRVAKINYADELYLIHNFALNRLRECGIEIPDDHIDRELLQYLGTDWGRKNYGPTVWVDMVKNKVGKEKLMHTDLVIIADARFENEFDAFEDSLRVRLVCPEEIRKSRCKKWGNTLHPSETSLDDYEAAGKFDLYLNTDTTPAQGCVELIMHQLLKPIEDIKRDRASLKELV